MILFRLWRTFLKFFLLLQEISNVPSECRTTDDIWIAGYLATRGIRRVILPMVHLKPTTGLSPLPFKGLFSYIC
jgi:hypothetical protein